MTLVNTTMMAVALALVAEIAAPVTRANTWNRTTTITTPVPVDASVDARSARHIVQAFNNKQAATYAALPIDANLLKAKLRALFHVDGNWGGNFVDSKSRGSEMAKTASSERFNTGAPERAELNKARPDAEVELAPSLAKSETVALPAGASSLSHLALVALLTLAGAMALRSIPG